MKQDEEEDDVAMDTEEEKEMQVVDAPELKPENLESSKASQRGRYPSTSCSVENLGHRSVTSASAPMFILCCFFSIITSRYGKWRSGHPEAR